MACCIDFAKRHAGAMKNEQIESKSSTKAQQDIDGGRW